MKSVSVGDLKAHLSRYLQEVKRGGEVHVLERGVPIARLVGMPAGAAEEADLRTRLVRDGVLRPGSGDVARVLREPPLRLTGADVSEALAEDREDRG